MELNITQMIGKKIKKISIDEGGEILRIHFDNAVLEFQDTGQSCCENRYMSCDGDDLSYWVGTKFKGYDIADAPNQEECGEVHEVQFLNIHTSKGVIVFSNHNEHNGWYGGFDLNYRVLGT